MVLEGIRPRLARNSESPWSRAGRGIIVLQHAPDLGPPPGDLLRSLAGGGVNLVRPTRCHAVHVLRFAALSLQPCWLAAR
jgi:hypothetical protein